MTLEDDLFYACLRYCDALNHYKTTREEMIYAFHRTESEKAKIMDFERGRVEHSLERLKEVMDKIDGELNEGKTINKRRC